MRPLLALLTLLPLTALATPLTMSHSGRLTSTTGAPIEGDHTVIVRLWPETGSAAWTGTFTNVPFSQGYYTVTLGDSTPLTRDIMASGPLFLGIEIDNGGEMPTRTKLHSGAYAMVASGVQLGDITLPCDSALEGTLRFHNNAAELCVNDAWVSIGGPPSGTSASPALTCDTLHTDFPAFGTGVYWVDPNGGATNDATQVYCEMGTAGGGWTRVGTVDGNLSICSFDNALGTAASVRNSVGNAWFDVSTTAQFFVQGEVLATRSDPAEWTRYASNHAGFTWENISNATVGVEDIVSTYAIQIQEDGDPGFIPVIESGCAVDEGDCLLGARRADNDEWTVTLGIGATGNQANCDLPTTVSYHGFVHETGWNHGGDIYVR